MGNNNIPTPEGWRELIRTDPEAFEAKRREVIESYISSVPADRQQRLRRLQWRIDIERKRAANPLQSCLSIYSMMMDSVYGDHGLLNAIYALRNAAPVTKKSADILPFRQAVDAG